LKETEEFLVPRLVTAIEFDKGLKNDEHQEAVEEDLNLQNYVPLVTNADQTKLIRAAASAITYVRFCDDDCPDIHSSCRGIRQGHYTLRNSHYH